MGQLLVVTFLLLISRIAFADSLTEAKDKLAVDQAQLVLTTAQKTLKDTITQARSDFITAQKAYDDAIYKQKSDQLQGQIPEDSKLIDTITASQNAQINQISNQLGIDTSTATSTDTGTGN